MSNDPRDLITFGSFRLSPASRTLRQAASVIPLAPKTFDLLLLLAESRGRVLTKRELMDTLWRDAFVEESSLVYQISALRKALGDEGSGWVESVPRIGYRFSAPVEFSDPPPDTLAPPAQPAVVPVRRPWPRPAWLAGGAAIAAVAAFGYWKISEVSRAREALPRMASLTEEGRFCEAFALANRIAPVLGSDAKLADMRREVSRIVTLDTEPPGAEAFYKDLRPGGGEWQPLGKTPLRDAAIPRGYFRLRFDKPGFEPSYAMVTAAANPMTFPLYPKEEIPPGMVPVPQTVFNLPRRFSPPARPSGSTRFLIDRHEVTNREFKGFIDAGGYRERRFWKQPFTDGAQTLTWEQAMAAFRDATGRPGPSTWEAGAYPPGRAEYPVSGVSWFEAGAYAEYAGKQLPTAWHWYAAARLDSGTWVVPASNFSGSGVARAGEYRGEGPFGTFDMAGNVSEWCWNQTDEGKRMILGGAWSQQIYKFTDPDARSPLDRSALNGFRCARYPSPPPESWLGPMRPVLRDLASAKPATNDLYQAYAAHYAYDRTELAAAVEAVEDSSPEWRRERITYSAAYGNGRIPALLFLPKEAKPPYLTVIYYPGNGALNTAKSETRSLEGWARIEYLLRAGRAVMYPVYQGTYERRLPQTPAPLQRREMIVQQVRDFRRAIDYLETRSDIAADRLALFAVSSGASLAPIPLAVDDRVKAAVLADGGLSLLPSAPEAAPLHFAPRARVPILMLNGKNDYIHPVEASQKALFRILGTPEAHKRHVLFDAAHEVVAVRTQVIREMLDWLDRYQGPVKPK